jgi:surface antigen Omp85-like protein
MGIRLVPVMVALASIVAMPAAAQDTRRETIEQQRSERAGNLAPYEPGRIESTLTYIERNRLLQRLFGGDGLYLRIGSVQRGGGMAFGAGYRQPFGARRVVFDVNGAITTKGYKVGAAQVSLPRLLGDHLTVTGRVRYRYFPQEDYFGIGPDSQKANRTTYLLEETEYGGIAALHIRPWLTWSSKVAHVSPRIGAGTDRLYPPIGDLFIDATAPGLARQPDFLETGTLLEIDSRDQPGNPRSGTYITLLGVRYRDLDDFGYDFSRVGGEIQHYFPVFDKKRVFAVRGAFNRYDPAAGSAVPFYYMLPVGGKDSIRGFSDFRFRDLTAVLLNAEYRWEAFSGLDMALFYDLGDAAHGWDDLSFGDLKQSYGIGLRFNTYRSIFMRTEVAFGSGEGTRFFVAFGGPLRLERYLR